MKYRIISQYIPEIGKVMYYPQKKINWFLFSYWDFQYFDKSDVTEWYYKLHGTKKAFDSLQLAKESLQIEIDGIKRENEAKAYGTKIHEIDL